MPDAPVVSPLAAAQARIQALEAALREAQAANQQLALASCLPDQNPNPVLRYNAAAERIYANPAAVRLRHQLGAPVAAVLRAQLRALAAQSLRDGQPYQTELRHEPYGLHVALVPTMADGTVNVYVTDVTARHLAERQMREQQAFYERVLDELPSQIAVFGPDTRYRYLNARSVPDEADRRQWMGKTMLDTAGFMGRPPEVAALRHNLMMQAVAERRAVEWQEAYPSDSDGIRHFLRYYQPVFGATGALEFIIAHNADITGRVQAEAQLREQQAFTALVLNTTPNVIYVRDLNQNFLFQNDACRVLRTEVVPSNALAPGSTAASERRAYAADDARVVHNQQEIVAEDCLTLPSGEVRWYHTVKRPLLRPDGAVHVLGVSTDITALKQAQSTLERSEKRYRDLMHYAQALICTYDLCGTLLSANPVLAALLGAPAEALPGQPVAAYLLADDRPAFARYLARIAASATGEAEGVVRVQGPGGERHLLYRNVMVREDGQAPYVISHAHDITDRVLAERATQRAREEAEATARARENFLSNMSHEIRTPMNGVLGMTAQLAKTPLNARQQELVRVVHTSGQHLLAVLNDVLDMAKITAGRLELAATGFNFCDSVGQALQPLVAQAHEKGLAFEGLPLGSDCPTPWVVGDAHRLNQIMLNLVSNAVKFTECGRVVVRAEQLSETASAVALRFSVADTGPGIGPAQQALVFESFAQAQADTARRYGGTGLGLSISRALVEQMGGTLALTSTLGVGSTFAFTLVLPKAEVPAEVPAGGPPPYDTGRLAGARVLLVEDNEISRTVVRMLLEPWGAQLDEVPDGPAALAQLAAAPPYDVVLMDIQLPGLSGVDTTARLRQLPDPARAATPVIALTANAFRADGERYLAAGFDDYLAKPYDEATLYHKIVALLPPSAPAYDLAHLRRLAQGRTPFVLKIIRSFLANAPTSLAQLRAAAAAQDWPQVARVVHHIKPNLVALGITRPAAAVALLTAPRPAEGPSAAHAQALVVLLAAAEQALRELPAELPA
ncbi:PAS domain-containing protein [Hymenobacter nivis]|uniref:Sensory/regulatory protein RpfC n=1 Tax=Hymenobacter nivis TaxID=1850093 RepID=A0A502HC54_9BACT|nr:PAS domain-containing protein [Hymenobacter nivis]TPG72237.1 PAS domain S-box protein [Hymenobacter nivis]